MKFKILVLCFLPIFTSVFGQVPPKTTPWKPLGIPTLQTKAALIVTQRAALITPVTKQQSVAMVTTVAKSQSVAMVTTVAKSPISSAASAPMTSSVEVEAPYILHKSSRLNYSEQVWRLFRVYGVPYCRYAFCDKLKNKRQEFEAKMANEKSALILGCQGKKYFLPPQNVTMVESWSVCCHNGMAPATFSTKQEMECFLKEFEKTADKANVNLLHTSHVDSNLDSLYVSCGNSKSTSRTLWVAGEPDNNGSGDACVLLNVKRGGLEDAACNLETRVLCEEVLKDSIPRPRSEKFVKQNMTKNKSYTSKTAAEIIQNNIPYCMSDFCGNKASLNEIQKAATDFTFMNACGASYAVMKSTTLKGHKEAWSLCCGIGMVPVSLDSVEEMNCLVQTLYPGKSWEKLGKQIDFHHTSQVDFYLNNSFESCITGKPIHKSLSPYLHVQPGKATIVGACVSFTVRNTGPRWVKTVCTNGGLVLCELGDLTTNVTTNMAAASATRNVENKIDTTNKTAYVEAPHEYFKTFKLSNCSSCNCKEHAKIPENNAKNGSLLEFSCEERAFVLTTVPVVYHEVWRQCCELGLVPASIDNQDYINCIQTKYSYSPGAITEKSFWTAQVDSTLDRRFISCKSGNPVRADVWMTGEPNNVGMREACVAVKLSATSAGLQDLRCGESLPVMCEKILPKSKIIPYIKHKKASLSYQPRIVAFHRKSGLRNCLYAHCNKKNISSDNVTMEATLNFGFPLTGCNGKTFFIPYPLVKFEMTWKTCCKFGMRPAVFNTRNEISCLKDLFNKTYVQVKGSWSPNVTNRVLTAHYDSMLDHTFIPCIPGKTTPDALWNDGEPNNNGGTEACAAIDILKPLFLYDMNCDQKPSQVLCELHLNT